MSVMVWCSLPAAAPAAPARPLYLLVSSETSGLPVVRTTTVEAPALPRTRRHQPIRSALHRPAGRTLPCHGASLIGGADPHPGGPRRWRLRPFPGPGAAAANAATGATAARPARPRATSG